MSPSALLAVSQGAFAPRLTAFVNYYPPWVSLSVAIRHEVDYTTIVWYNEIMESIITALRAWNKTTSERTKLQHVYVAIIVVVTVVAGLVSLIHAELGRQVLTLAGIAVVAFLANAVVWALTRVYLLGYLERKRPASKK